VHEYSDRSFGNAVVLLVLKKAFETGVDQDIAIAKRASDVIHITRTNSDKQNGMVEDLTLFQARKQVLLKTFLKPKFGVRSLFLAEHAYGV